MTISTQTLCCVGPTWEHTSCHHLSEAFLTLSLSWCRVIGSLLNLFSFSFFKLINLFIFLYNIVLVLPYNDLNPPWVYMCSPSRTPLPPPIPLGHPSAPAPSTLYHTSNLDWQFISHMIIYMFQCHSPISYHPRPLPQSSKDCSVHLCLFCCLAYRVIITIFLNSIHRR